MADELEFEGVVIPDEVAIITDRRVDYTIVPPEGVGKLDLPIVAADGRAPEDVFSSDESDEDADEDVAVEATEPDVVPEDESDEDDSDEDDK